MGRPVVLDVALTNSGPDTAYGVVVTHAFPGGLLVDAVEAATGVFTNLPGQVIWRLDEFAAGLDSHLLVTMIPTQPAGLTNIVHVVSDGIDENPGNDEVTIPWEVYPLADLRLSLVTSADRVMVNDALSYGLRAQNLAPYAVPNVQLEDVLPEGVDLVEALASQGTTNRIGRSVIADFGEMAPGSEATLAITVVPRQLGAITNTARLLAVAADPLNPTLAVVAVTQVLRDPPMEVVLTQGKIQISWPAVAGSFELQSASHLRPPADWRLDSSVPQMIDGRLVVTIKPLAAERFFRLVRTTP